MDSVVWSKHYGLLFLTAIFLHSPFAHSLAIELQPDSLFASSGESISLDLVVSDLGSFEPDSLGAFDVSVGFDTSILAFESYTLGGFLGDPGLEALDFSLGGLGASVNVAEVSLLSVIALDALQPSGFTLASLNFKVIDLAAGARSEISILPSLVLADAFGSSLVPTALESAIIEGRSSPVPAPGVLYLFVLSLMGLLVIQKKPPQSITKCVKFPLVVSQ